MAILIENGLVVTGAPGGTRHEPGSLLLEGERIAWIGPAGEEPPAARAGGVEVIDARRSIVLPGLINAHMHSNEGFEQGCYDGLPLELWLLESYPPFDLPELSERQHYLRTMVCALQSIRSGVTTVQDDLLVVGSTPAPVDGAVKAYTDAGLRAVVTVAMWDRPFLDCLPWLRELVPTDLQLQLDRLPAANAKDQVASFERHHRTWQGHADRIRVVPAPSGPQRCSDDLLCAAADLSARHDLPVHIHVLETKAQAVTGLEFYGKTLVAHLDSVGLLTPRLTMNHAIWLTEADIAILGERGCSISHNPLSNQKLASGICPVHELLAAGVNVALGTDGLATSDTGDLIAALRAGSLLHKLRGHAPGGWIGAEQVFRMATAGGARSVGLESDVGSLEVGRRADVILLDRDDWGFIPLNDPIRQLAFSVTSEAVRTSIIGGRVVMRDRVITSLDEAAVKAEVQELAERFRREWRPRMHDGAGRVAPYVRAAYERATAMALPDLPQRMLPEPKAAPLGKARP